jgi:hypothetical protein
MLHSESNLFQRLPEAREDEPRQRLHDERITSVLVRWLDCFEALDFSTAGCFFITENLLAESPSSVKRRLVVGTGNFS